MWGSDYPHQDSSFPNSARIMAEHFGGVPLEDQLKIGRQNAIALYNSQSSSKASTYRATYANDRIRFRSAAPFVDKGEHSAVQPCGIDREPLLRSPTRRSPLAFR